jgi:hypothetical protein
MRDEDIHKTAFQIPDGLMEWVAMPFGLCNAPVFLQRMVNDILRDFLHNFVVNVYLDDVCIYNRTPEEHMEHLRLVQGGGLEFTPYEILLRPVRDGRYGL